MSVARWLAIATVGGVFSFACSAKLTADDPDGTGGAADTEDTDNDGSGGRKLSSSGGRSSGGMSSGSGGRSASGGAGSGGEPTACEDDEEEECAEHSDEFSLGTAVCADGEWDLSDCKFCKPEGEVECAIIAPDAPVGTLICDEDGLGWVEEPEDVCAACEPENDAIDCDSAANPTDNRGGVASCTGEGSFDFDECTLCDDELAPPSCDELTDGARPVGVVTCDAGTAWSDTGCMECDATDYEASLDCVDLPSKEHDFTGGVAHCGTDSSWDQSTCEYCGDGAVGANEECESALPAAATCDELGFVNDVETSCTDRCTWSTTACTYCPGTKCLSDGACSGSNCNDKECSGTCTFGCDNSAKCQGTTCGTGSTCNLNCLNNGSVCAGAVCKPEALCNFDCKNGGKCEDVLCTGATCNFNCENDGSVCSSLEPFTCEDGKTCSFNCQNGADCSGLEVTCKVGSTCNIDCDNNGTGCVRATCEAGADCRLSCQNSTCTSVVVQ